MKLFLWLFLTVIWSVMFTPFLGLPMSGALAYYFWPERVQRLMDDAKREAEGEEPVQPVARP